MSNAMVEPLKVHRCRFVDWTPSPITAISFPPIPLKRTQATEPHFGLLVVGRANGNIELSEWTGDKSQAQARQAWVLKKLLPGPVPSKVDSLALTWRDPDAAQDSNVSILSKLRLFSAGGGFELLEWNLEQGCIRRSMASQGGSIWSISANSSCTRLALGCEDGSVHILSLENDDLYHHRRFDRVRARLLSIAWGPPNPPSRTTEAVEKLEQGTDKGSNIWTDTWLVTGCSDSSIRRWDINTGRMLERMGTDKARGERTLVWAVGVLGDGTIISGDSLGMVKFWDFRTGTQLQSFQGHGADVLCLAIGPEGRTLFTSGVDQKISEFSRVDVEGDSSSHSRWIHSCSRRMHSHDVRAIAIWPPYVPAASRAAPGTISIAPILASGGLDMSVVLCPCAVPSVASAKAINPLATSLVSTFEDSYHRRLPYANDSVHVAREARLILCQRDTGLALWKIHNLPTPKLDFDEIESADQTGWIKALEMELKVQSNLLSSAISSDGRWLAVSDHHETKLFRLIANDNEPTELHPKRLKTFSSILSAQLPESKSTGASAVLFTADSSKLILATISTAVVAIIDLHVDPLSAVVLRVFSHHRIRDFAIRDGQVSRVMKGLPGESNPLDSESIASTTIRGLAASADGQWLASTDLHGRTHIYNLDSVQHHCTLPSFQRPVKTLAFDPSSTGTLVLAFPDNTLQIFDVESRNFPEWSRSLIDSIPASLGIVHDVIQGITFVPAPIGATASHAILWASSWLCKVKLGEPARLIGWKKKRQRESTKDSSQINSGKEEDLSLKLITKYRPILVVDFVGSNELVVVERPLLDILSTLPPAYFKPKYGS